jgi:hypothetical protein
MSEVKVNKISPRTACGTVTLGDSGDTFTIPSGATITNAGTATGFGATGAVNWDTGSIKTATFTAVSGSGYFCNTTAGVFNITLPASPSAGDIVGLKDYAGTFATYNLTIDRNGSKLDSNAGNRVLNTDQRSLTMVYVDGTQGWKSVEEGTGDIGATFVTATGGTPCSGAIVCGNYKQHTFTGPGTFCVSAIGTTPACNVVDYLIVAGGAGGGAGDDPSHGAGGGGAGGYRESPGTATGCYTVSPLGTSPAAAVTVTAQGYPIVVGGGGAGSTSSSARGVSGVSSTAFSLTSAGGGGGGVPYYPTTVFPGSPGGSGGGGASEGSGTGGTGNDPPVTPPQGSNGGAGVNAPTPTLQTGGGGGAIAVGTSGTGGGAMGAGGAGATSSINATPTARAGGGGGGPGGPSCSSNPGPGGAGGGGAGSAPGSTGTAGTTNTGGGGGGGAGLPGTCGGNGGSGVVILRYKFQ